MNNYLHKASASVMFFTRLPLWRVINPSKEDYADVVTYWPLTGWITGGVAAFLVYYLSMILPFHVALIIAIAARVVLTGALHEDGFADFIDGFGGGRDKERILAIMKDSHIGSYGVIGLILYYLLLFSALYSFGPSVAAMAILAADPFSKFLAGQMINRLPYARSEEDCKSGILYDEMDGRNILISLGFGIVPLMALFDYKIWASTVLPFASFFAFTFYIRRKIGGYTGDCCGALFVICEISFYLALLATGEFQTSGFL